MIRILWVLLAGSWLTFFHAGTVVLRSYLWPRRLSGVCDRAARNWARGILRAAGVRVTLEGTEHLSTDAPQIVASNHQSWFDVFALAATLPVRYRFVAKEELGRIPIFGRSWKACGHVSVDRGNREAAIEALDLALREVYENKLTMVVFPEGTRSSDGRLQRFKKGAFVLAIQAQVPLVPVAVLGSREIMGKGDFRIRSGTIHIRIGAPLSTAGLTVKERDRLMRDSRAGILALMGEEEPAGPAGEASP